MKPMINDPYDRPEALDREQKLNAIGWGSFFLWVGIAWLTGIGWGPGLLVTGLIILGGQAARRHFALGAEGFWVAVGVLFVLCGAWVAFNVQVGLVPIVCVLAGIALLVSTFRRHHAH